ncbi:MAG: hypothetical protein RLZZ420_1127 [Bacteroidota bacterium]|jgi:Asp-tRNA(Asn)/Glu-tRNA(Gln) amidotransferase A subunit family amidase
MKKILSFFLIAAIHLTSIHAQDTISKADVVGAAKLIALQYSAKEIEMMLPDLRDNMRDYEQMQRYPLNNNVQVSMVQQLALDKLQQKQIKWRYDKTYRLPVNKEDLAFCTINQLGSLLRNHSISSVELTHFFLERMKKYSDTLQCVVSMTETIALEQAAQADLEFSRGIDRGPLHGIPYGLKDLFAVKGTKTTWGAEPYKNQSIDQDAYVYTKLKNAGAVLIAKFTLGALAMGDYWFGGRTKNPWNLERGSSGSSAGSAAATVAGIVPFAIGTETHGSIISPSHTCGATGLRPTFGSISRSGAMTLSWSLDKVGPICRNTVDAATVFASLHGTDGKDISAGNPAFNLNLNADIRKLKIGYAANHFEKLDTAGQEWGVIKALKEAGINPEPMHLPDTEVYKFDIIGIVVGAESAAAFDEFTRTGLDDAMTRQTRNDWPNYFRVSRTIPAVEYINANRHRTILMEAFNRAMKDYDVVITPTYGGRQLAITNLTGHPALCLPIGLNKQGLPNSITMLANLYQEEVLVTAGKYYQEITGHDDKHPPLFR